MDTKKIVQPAIDAVKDGRQKFILKETLKLISIGWKTLNLGALVGNCGGGINVWYDEDGKYYCALSEEKAQEISGNKKLVRDTDVLDTWFSSGIWPIATLGWPSNNSELDKYFPTSVLVTGFDILFFWVARMMMMQLVLVDNVPFKKVYVHALVRDEKEKNV